MNIDISEYKVYLKSNYGSQEVFLLFKVSPVTKFTKKTIIT